MSAKGDSCLPAIVIAVVADRATWGIACWVATAVQELREDSATRTARKDGANTLKQVQQPNYRASDRYIATTRYKFLLECLIRSGSANRSARKQSRDELARELDCTPFVRHPVSA
jgi:hypothetical protein